MASMLAPPEDAALRWWRPSSPALGRASDAMFLARIQRSCAAIRDLGTLDLVPG